MKNNNDQTQWIFFNLNYLLQIIIKKWYIILVFFILAFLLALWKTHHKTTLFEVKMILTSKLISQNETDKYIGLNIQTFELLVKQFRDNYFAKSLLRQKENSNYLEKIDEQYKYFYDLSTAPLLSESDRFRNRHLYIIALLTDSSKTNDFVFELKQFINSTSVLQKTYLSSLAQLDSTILITERNISELSELHMKSKNSPINSININNNYIVDLDRLQKELIELKSQRENFEICEIIVPSRVVPMLAQSKKFIFIIYSFFGIFLGLIVALFIDQTVKR